MKYYPYARLETTSFKPLLTSARVLGVLSIAGIFTTLIIAGYSYINFDPNQIPLTQTAKSLTNAILVGGISTSFISMAISGMLAWLVDFTNKKPSIKTPSPIRTPVIKTLTVATSSVCLVGEAC